MLPIHLHIIAYLFPSTYFVNVFRFYALKNIEIQYATVPIIQLAILFTVCILINFIVFKVKFAKLPKSK
jgi:ABC-type multidrug transport system permease subunit